MKASMYVCVLISLALVVKASESPDLSVKITGGGHKLDIVAEEDGEKRGHFQFTTNGFPRWRVRTFSNGTETFKFRMGIFDLIEFKDEGERGLDSANEIVSKLRLTGKTQQWTSISQEDLGNDQYHFSTYLPLQDGKLQFDMWISRTTTDLQLRNGTTIVEVGPNRLEFALTIENYPFQETNSSLAVRALITSGAEAVVNGERISLGDEGFFEWNNTVTCISPEGTETTEDLIPSSLTNTVVDAPNNAELDVGKEGNEDNNFVVFSIPCSSPYKVVWDPSIGYQMDSEPDQESGSENASSLLSGFVLSSLVTLFVNFW